MSENLLTLIPTDAEWSPPAERDAVIVGAVADIVPSADQVAVERLQEVSFFDAGANFERVLCPVCGTELSVEWWQGRMEVAHAGRFEELSVLTPCCSRRRSLNDLTYDWPQGFSRWAVVVRSPERKAFTEAEVARLGEIAGHLLRQILSHH